MSKSKDTPVMSLVDYARAKRREDCPVCALPEDIRQQIVMASDRGIRRRQVIEWLREIVKAQITEQELTTHRNGRHDDAA